MITSFIVVGTVPRKEPYISTMAYEESQALLNLVRRHFGPEPPKVRLKIRNRVVICYFDLNDVPSMEYASLLSSQQPSHWDIEALLELGMFNPKPPLSPNSAAYWLHIDQTLN